jgi:23S rRNA (pseudouridine1915-N3)-methyltransferase
MQIHLVFIGKTAFPDLDSAINRYLERIRRYVPAEIHIVKPEKIGRNTPEEAVREREGARVLSLAGKEGFLVLWDQRGKQLDSPELARELERIQEREASKVWMIVGGPVGVPQSLVARADLALSLSRMTFPHDIARLLIVEQLYRAFTILKGEPYHK